MGAVSPVPFVTKEIMEEVDNYIITPTIEGMIKENIIYKGFYFIGLILVKGKVKVIEYNCRMGDPETQVVIPLLKNDLVKLFMHCEDGTLDKVKLEKHDKTAVTVVIASKGYPEKYKTGIELSNLETNEDTIIFHAGTKIEGKKIVSSGGRVLTVTSFGKNISETVNKSFQVSDKINFKAKYFRRDIGYEFIDKN